MPEAIFIPHASTIVSPPFMLPSCAIAGVHHHIQRLLFVFLHHTVLLHAWAHVKECNTTLDLRSHIQPKPLHILSAIISERKGNFIFFQIDVAALAVLIQYPLRVYSSFLLNLNRRLITFCTPTFDSVQGCPAPRPTLTSKTEHAEDFFHHSSALYPPRHIFALEDLCIPPPRFISTLLSFFHTFFHFTCWIEDGPGIVKLFSKEACAYPTAFRPSSHPLFVSMGTRPPHTCQFWFQIPSPSFLD